MSPGILGRKEGMTRVVDPTGVVTTVTVVRAGPCTVLQVKNNETDGYDAVQVGFEDVKPHRSTKPRIGHCAKSGVGPKRFIRELRSDDEVSLSSGDVMTVAQFVEGEVKYVDVTGTSKGKGFAGPMKRWGFGGQPASHGTERKHRSPGSIGGHANLGMGRGVRKGKKMAGHMGHERITQRCLKLIDVDTENNLLLIKGSIPGPNGGLVMVRQAKTKG